MMQGGWSSLKFKTLFYLQCRLVLFFYRSYIEPEESFRRSLKLSLLLRCPTSGSKDNLIHCLSRKSPEDISRLELEVLSSRKSWPGSTFVPTIDSKYVPMDPKAMLKRITLYSRDLSVLVGSNDWAANRDLEKILPNFYTEGNVKFSRISRELFEESLQKMFPFHGEGASICKL